MTPVLECQEPCCNEAARKKRAERALKVQQDRLQLEGCRVMLAEAYALLGAIEKEVQKSSEEAANARAIVLTIRWLLFGTNWSMSTGDSNTPSAIEGP